MLLSIKEKKQQFLYFTSPYIRINSIDSCNYSSMHVKYTTTKSESRKAVSWYSTLLRANDGYIGMSQQAQQQQQQQQQVSRLNDNVGLPSLVAGNHGGPRLLVSRIREASGRASPRLYHHPKPFLRQHAHGVGALPHPEKNSHEAEGRVRGRREGGWDLRVTFMYVEPMHISVFWLFFLILYTIIK